MHDTSKELSQVCSYKCKSGAQTLGTMQGKEKESAARIKKFMTMMDSMTNKELDSPDPKLWQQESRIMRIARGAGVHPNYVGELIGGPSPMIEAADSSAEPWPCAGVCRGFACSASCHSSANECSGMLSPCSMLATHINANHPMSCVPEPCQGRHVWLYV